MQVHFEKRVKSGTKTAILGEQHGNGAFSFIASVSGRGEWPFAPTSSESGRLKTSIAKYFYTPAVICHIPFVVLSLQASGEFPFAQVETV
ncbi:hypothetical protein KKE26_06615 [bacterium]|nr:hypothetical protein [bacterium]